MNPFRLCFESIAQLAAEFHAVRQSTVMLFENLPETAWQSVGRAIGENIFVRKQATILLGHVAHHWAILKQRFSF